MPLRERFFLSDREPGFQDRPTTCIYPMIGYPMIVASLVCLCLSLCWSDASARTKPGRAAETLLELTRPDEIKSVRLTHSKSRTIRIGRPYNEVLVANASIADVVALTDQSLYIVGKRIGLTRLTLLGHDKHLLGIIEIEVSLDIDGLHDELKRSVPSGQFRLGTANGRIILGGVVPDAMALSRAVSLAEQFTSGCDEQSEPQQKGPASSTPGPQQAPPAGPPGQAKGGSEGPPSKCFINTMTVRSPQQVLLEVRFVEAHRSASRDLGFNWEVASSRVAVATGIGGMASNAIPFGAFVARVLDGGTTADVMIQALERRGIARRLAEPNLVTLSGDTANFLAGGEFPFPVASDRDRITIEFKKFGVGLAFTPTVLADGQINLKIEPEVSDLDPSNAVQIGGTLIPSLVVRRANTTVELRDGQSFAIAGLLQSKHSKNARELPWISTVPVLGTLFRSAAYEKNESDLVIIVTPRLVQPAKPGQKLATPHDQMRPANDRDFFLGGRLEVPKHWNAPYGHILDSHGAPPAPSQKAWRTDYAPSK